MNRIQPLAIALLLLTAGRAMAEPGNAARGERMYRACVACHSLEPNRNMTGPSLAEIWNRTAGSLPSFPRYSPALKCFSFLGTSAVIVFPSAFAKMTASFAANPFSSQAGSPPFRPPRA